MLIFQPPTRQGRIEFNCNSISEQTEEDFGTYCNWLSVQFLAERVMLVQKSQNRVSHSIQGTYHLGHRGGPWVACVWDYSSPPPFILILSPFLPFFVLFLVILGCFLWQWGASLFVVGDHPFTLSICFYYHWKVLLCATEWVNIEEIYTNKSSATI